MSITLTIPAARIIGIDPGLSGGLVLLANDDPGCTATKMPATLRDLRDWLVGCGEATVYLEDARPNPKNGSIAVGKMMRNVGQCEATVVGCGLRLERVAATVWQLPFGLRRKPGETDTQKKNRHKAKAQELFPAIEVTHAIADALLIAEYGRRVCGTAGDQRWLSKPSKPPAACSTA